MRNLLLFTTLIFFCTTLSSQKVYWNCSLIDVDDDARVVRALDAYMDSDLGKSLPMVTLSEMVNTNTTIDASHQICILTDNPSVLDNMDAKFANMQGAILGSVWQDEVEGVSSILGSPLIMNPSGLSNEYSNVYSISVLNPAAYAEAFTALIAAFPDVVFELHEAISGAENGVTHYVVTRATGIGEWLQTREKVYASKAFQTYAASASGNATLISSASMRLVKSYNAPSE